MMEDEASDSLVNAAQVINQAFSNLDLVKKVLLSVQSERQVFLSVSPKQLQSSDLQYLPSFSVLVRTSSQTLNALDLCLICFNGNILQSETLSSDQVSSSRLLAALNQDQISLCQGLDAKVSSQCQDVLTELIASRIVRRSQSCEYAIFLDQSGSRTCRACTNASSNPSFDAIRDIEPLKEEGVGVKLEPDENFDDKRPKRAAIKEDFDPDGKDPDLEFEEEDLELHFLSEEDLDESQDAVASPRSKKKGGKSNEVKFCPGCKKSYRSKVSFDKHVKRCVHGQVDQDEYSEKCVLCLRHFNSERQHVRHMAFHKSKHQGLEEPVKCPECSLELKTKYELNPHFQSVHGHGKGCCIICFSSFEAVNLRRHLYNSHIYNEKTRLCPTCGKSFSTPLRLRVHISSVHDTSGANSVVCDQCGKVFPHKIKLSHHVYHSHNNTRLYPCHSCDKVFQVPMAYYKHIKVHSLVKPWSCKICSFRAVRKDNVRQHVRKVHKVDNILDFVVKDGQIIYDDGALKRKMMKTDGPRNFVKLDVNSTVPTTEK